MWTLISTAGGERPKLKGKDTSVMNAASLHLHIFWSNVLTVRRDLLPVHLNLVLLLEIIAGGCGLSVGASSLESSPSSSA
jgi:hypothetical protein